jgi:cell division protein FtsI (penicillin-binding protein 3)
MAEEQGKSRFGFRWPFAGEPPLQRPPAPAPFEWRLRLRSRLYVCAIALGLWTAGIEARLLYLQVISHDEMVARAKKQQTRTVKPAAPRGAILDRDGRLLAYSVDADTIAVNPREIGDPAATARRLCQALDECDAARRGRIEAELRRDNYFAFVARQVTAEEASRVQALEIEGVSIYKESRRFYPNLGLAAHVLGFVGIDNKGLAGIEAAYDTRIKGKEGLLVLQTDGRQRAVSAREESAATPGDSVQLTIDTYLQHIAERELKAGVDEFNAAGGTVVIMQPHTGEILALANYPTFNPNIYRTAAPETRKNRAIQDVYEPGSTFKLVTASAAIEEGLLSTTDLIDCAPGFITFAGRVIRDVHPYGALTFEDVIVKSSNVGAIKAGLKIGPERLGRYVNRFGFGSPLSPDFRGESGGIVWNPADLGPSALASVSMGYQVGVTPLQMAAAVSSVANGGTLYEPRVVKAFIRDGRREEVVPKVLRRTVTSQTAATMTRIMEGVVERGTAKQAQLEGYTIAGKTGTAQKLVDGRYSKSDYNVSFVGFLPSRNPALTVVVLIDSPHGKVTSYGGTVAAPIFQRIAEPAMRHLGIGPNLNPAPPVIVARAEDRDDTVRPVGGPDINAVLAPARMGLVPDVRGLSAREAVRSLLRIGLTPRLDGNGFVLEQLPAPGTPLVPGEGALLKLGRRLPATSGSPQQ